MMIRSSSHRDTLHSRHGAPMRLQTHSGIVPAAPVLTDTNADGTNFGGAFHQADAVFVTDIYAASETPIAGVTSAELAERIRKFGHRSVNYNGSLESGIEAIAGEAMEGDVIVTLGAGSVSQAGESLLRKLKEKL